MPHESFRNSENERAPAAAPEISPDASAALAESTAEVRAGLEGAAGLLGEKGVTDPWENLLADPAVQEAVRALENLRQESLDLAMGTYRGEGKPEPAPDVAMGTYRGEKKPEPAPDVAMGTYRGEGKPEPAPAAA